LDGLTGCKGSGSGVAALSMHAVVSMHTRYPTLAARRQLNLNFILQATCQVMCCTWLSALNMMYLTHGLAYWPHDNGAHRRHSTSYSS
jgi:hypothetical protein